MYNQGRAHSCIAYPHTPGLVKALTCEGMNPDLTDKENAPRARRATPSAMSPSASPRISLLKTILEAALCATAIVDSPRGTQGVGCVKPHNRLFWKIDAARLNGERGNHRSKNCLGLNMEIHGGGGSSRTLHTRTPSARAAFASFLSAVTNIVRDSPRHR